MKSRSEKMGRMRRGSIVVMAWVVATVALARGSFAQVPVPAGRPIPATPDLSPGHWAMDALRRAESLGLLSQPLPFRGAISIGQAGDALSRAASAAEVSDPSLVRLTEGWRDRFYREFGGLLASSEEAARLVGVRVTLEGADHSGRAEPGQGEYGESRTGAVLIDDEAWVGAEVEVSAALGDHVGLLLQPAATTDGTRLRRFEAAMGWGNWRLSAGRQPVALRKSQATGLILSGAVTLDRLTVATERPATLPGWMRVLGPTGVEFFVTRLWDDERHEREPFLWGGTLSVQPFPRLGLAVHRAAMFGGRGHDQPITVKSLIDMLIGRVANLGFENQIASLEARYRLPTEHWLPLTAYLEWGTEDAAGAWWDVPGRVIGLEAPAIPGLEALALGGAYTSIADPCCFNPPWYRHSAFPGNWAVGDLPLGHPLGGEGWEWRAFGSLDRPQEGYRLSAELFHRDRTGQNLYAPERGRSDGAVVRASWRERPGLELAAEAMVESGRGWSERALHLGADYFF